MHTMDGKPAVFDKNDQDLYFSSKVDLKELPKYLHQIRKEQRIAMDKDQAFPYRTFDYSYIIVRLK